MATAPDFQINGNTLPSPTSHGWINPEDRGIDGLGQRRYNPHSSFEIRWSIMDQSDFNDLNSIWLGQYGSGTSTVRLPQYDVGTYAFKNYTGTVVDKPTNGNYNENFVNDVKILIRKITV